MCGVQGVPDDPSRPTAEADVIPFDRDPGEDARAPGDVRTLDVRAQPVLGLGEGVVTGSPETARETSTSASDSGR